MPVLHRRLHPLSEDAEVFRADPPGRARSCFLARPAGYAGMTLPGLISARFVSQRAWYLPLSLPQV